MDSEPINMCSSTVCSKVETNWCVLSPASCVNNIEWLMMPKQLTKAVYSNYNIFTLLKLHHNFVVNDRPNLIIKFWSSLVHKE